jgi:hypothetical protein
MNTYNLFFQLKICIMHYVEYALQLLGASGVTTDTTIYTIVIYTPIFIFLYVYGN